MTSVGMLLLGSTAWGQNSSLYQRPFVMQENASISAQPTARPSQDPSSGTPASNTAVANPAVTGVMVGQPSPFSQASWTYVPAQSARKLKIHDIVSIRVDEMAQTTAQGNASSRKNTIYDAKLADWVRLDGLSLKPAPQSSGDPRVGGQENEVYRADSTMRTKESMTFNIAAEIADIRPNGVVVLSAHKTIRNNDNAFEVALTGLCRADDIGPDNTVLSKHIFDLDISKDDRGHVRDGYSRGWFTRLLARVKPF